MLRYFTASLIFLVSATSGATDLASRCAQNRIDPRFQNNQIFAGKVDCIYGVLAETIGSGDMLVQQAFVSGKFKAARESLLSMQKQITLDSLTEDGQLTAKALQEVLTPKILPPLTPAMTVNQLRDKHVESLRK